MTNQRVLRPGDNLADRYRVESVLGSGGMGVVYKARDLRLDQTIALKVLRGGSASLDELRREIVLARRVTHENVCRIYDLEEIDGYECVSMEYIDGESLFDLRHRLGSSFPVGKGLEIAKQICRGLAAAHRTGVVHRDLKPENILIDGDNTTRIMDFGIASAADMGSSEAPGTIVGTPQFMPPERLRGEEIDVRGDIYSLGVIFFEMFTGRLPFDADEIATLAAKVTYDLPPSPSDFNPEVPEEISLVILRCLAKSPEDRYQNALELLRDIERSEGLLVDQVLTEMSLAKARLVRLLSVLEANKALSSALDLDPILKLILDVATNEIGAERGTIFMLDADHEELVSRTLIAGEVREIRIPITTGIAGAVATSGEHIVIEDAYEDPRFNRNVDKKTGYRTSNLIAVPMRNPAGRIVGVLELLNKTKGPFSPADGEYLEDVSVHAAVAIDTARRHEEAIIQAAESSRLETSQEVALLAKSMNSAPEHIEAAWDGQRAGAPAGLFAAETMADGSLAFLFASDGGESFSASLHLAKLGATFYRSVAAGHWDSEAISRTWATLGAPFGPDGPRAVGGRINPDGSILLESAAQPVPIVLQPSGDQVQSVRADQAGLRLEPGAIVFFPDEDLLTLQADDGEVLGVDPVIRFLRTHPPTTPADAIATTNRLVSIYAGGGDAPWFCAAFKPRLG